MFDAKPSDLSIMPFGMCARQLSIGRPKIRNGMPLRRKCAATESPYGPAPMIAVLSMPEQSLLWYLSHLAPEIRGRAGDPQGKNMRECLVYHGRSKAFGLSRLYNQSHTAAAISQNSSPCDHTQELAVRLCRVVRPWIEETLQLEERFLK